MNSEVSRQSSDVTALSLVLAKTDETMKAVRTAHGQIASKETRTALGKIFSNIADVSFRLNRIVGQLLESEER